MHQLATPSSRDRHIFKKQCSLIMVNPSIRPFILHQDQSQTKFNSSKLTGPRHPSGPKQPVIQLDPGQDLPDVAVTQLTASNAWSSAASRAVASHCRLSHGGGRHRWTVRRLGPCGSATQNRLQFTHLGDRASFPMWPWTSSDSASCRVTVLDATKLASMRRKTYVADKIITTRNSREQPSRSGYISFPLKRSRIALSTRKKHVVLNFLHSLW